MNKWLCKKVLEKAALPVIPYQLSHQTITRLPSGWQFPLILKPLSQGSSIDVFLIQNHNELKEKSSYLNKKYQEFLIEPYIEGKELTVGLLETPTLNALPILELQSKNSFYDFNAKYTKGKTDFIIPAHLTKDLTTTIQSYAIKAHKALSCSGFSRVDFRLSKNNIPYIMEINTIPGLTETSDLPAQANAANISFIQLIEYMLYAALKNNEKN